MRYGVLTVGRHKFTQLLLVSCVMLAGCTVNRPLDYDSPAVVSICNSADGDTVAVTHQQQQKQVTVDFVASWDELYEICGESGGACVNMASNIIYMVDDRSCERHASHELAHLFGIEGMDTLGDIRRRRDRFYSR